MPCHQPAKLATGFKAALFRRLLQSPAQGLDQLKEITGRSVKGNNSEGELDQQNRIEQVEGNFPGLGSRETEQTTGHRR
jgi:hypothetical protein